MCMCVHECHRKIPVNVSSAFARDRRNLLPPLLADCYNTMKNFTCYFYVRWIRSPWNGISRSLIVFESHNRLIPGKKYRVQKLHIYVHIRKSSVSHKLCECRKGNGTKRLRIQLLYIRWDLKTNTAAPSTVQPYFYHNWNVSREKNGWRLGFSNLRFFCNS